MSIALNNLAVSILKSLGCFPCSMLPAPCSFSSLIAVKEGPLAGTFNNLAVSILITVVDAFP